VLVTLALGIGSSTAVFSVVNAVLLKPLPYPEPARLMLLVHSDDAGRQVPGVSEPKFTTWKTSTTAIADAAAYRFPALMNVTSRDRQEQIVGGQVTAGFFHLFGATFVQGHAFTTDDDRPGGPPVVVLSHGYWMRQFGGATDVVGQALALNRVKYEVVGVLGPTFDARSTAPRVAQVPDVWVPPRIDPSTRTDANTLLVAGRLRPHLSLDDAAQAQTREAVERFRREFPGVLAPNLSLTLVPLQRIVVEPSTASLQLLLATVGCLLLIACANMATLLFVRASERQREFAVHSATGASRNRLIRQVLAECAFLAMAGGALGIASGFVGMRSLLAIEPGNLPRIAQDGSDVMLDWRVLLFASMVSAAIIAGAGLLPALRISRVDLLTTLRLSPGNAAGTAKHRGSARMALVIVEVALASVLLVAATLLVRSVAATERVDPGFDSRQILTLRTTMTDERFASTVQTAAVISDGAARLTAIPGVEAVGVLLTDLPLEGDANLQIEVVGRGRDDGILGSWRPVSSQYFDVFRIPLVKGRLFTERDGHRAPPVALVNEALARRLWPNRDPLGDFVVLGRGAGPEFDDGPRQIVGIVGDVRQGGLRFPPRHAVYLPIAQLPNPTLTFVNQLGGRLTWAVRTTGDPLSAAAAARAELTRVTNAPVGRIRSMDDVVWCRRRARGSRCGCSPYLPPARCCFRCSGSTA
jgi:putative ABC transport system permease protein